MSRFEHKIPPPLVLIASALLMWAVVRVFPQLAVQLPGHQGCSLGCVALGAIIALTGVWAFRCRGTTINPLEPQQASALVSTGIYRRTRNPMYLGMWVALLGWAIFLSNPVAGLGLVFFVLVLNRLQIIPEERALAKLFGSDFRSYCSRVRRWV